MSRVWAVYAAYLRPTKETLFVSHQRSTPPKPAVGVQVCSSHGIVKKNLQCERWRATEVLQASTNCGVYRRPGAARLLHFSVPILWRSVPIPSF